jgi:GNAT superfamily N-acetyltransferase
MEAKTNVRAGTIADVNRIHELIMELAEYERAPQEVTLTPEQLKADGFGTNPAFSFIVAEINERVVGMALYYFKYSTWKGRCLFLEDLIVEQESRQKGVGLALFDRLVEISLQKGARRLEWQVLDWNEPAIGFYKKIGAELDAEWINGRFTHEGLMAYQKRKDESI